MKTHPFTFTDVSLFARHQHWIEAGASGGCCTSSKRVAMCRFIFFKGKREGEKTSLRMHSPLDRNPAVILQHL